MVLGSSRCGCIYFKNTKMAQAFVFGDWAFNLAGHGIYKTWQIFSSQ